MCILCFYHSNDPHPPLHERIRNKSVFTKTSMLKNPFLPDIQSASDHEFFNLDSFSRFICNIGFVLAVLGLHCCSGFPPRCGKREHSLVAVCGKKVL